MILQQLEHLSGYGIPMISVIIPFVFLKLAPYLKKQAQQYEYVEKKKSRIEWMKYIDVVGYWLQEKSDREGYEKKPMFFNRWVEYLFLQGIGYIVLLIVTSGSILNQGVEFSLSWSSLEYDLIFAKTSNTLIGSHASSYFLTCVFAWIVLSKTRNIFLALSSVLFLDAIHETGWFFLTIGLSRGIVLGYNMFSQGGLFQIALLSLTYGSAIFTFCKIKPNPMIQNFDFKRFLKIVIIPYTVYLVSWLGGGYIAGYGLLISTFNNQPTVYANSIIGNLPEVISWALLVVLMFLWCYPLLKGRQNKIESAKI